MEDKSLKKYSPPTVAELFTQSDSLAVAYGNDKLNELLSVNPPAEWVKEHPFIKNHKYMPIDKVEYLLRRIFKSYKIEVLTEGTAFNGVFVRVRVHYLNPATGEWAFHDGIGASQLQTAKGTSAADLMNINNGAISMAFPLAKTLAIKDAVGAFGNLFGANLNRRDTLQNTPDASLQSAYVSAEQKRRAELIEACTDIKALEKLREEAMGYDLMDLYNQKYAELQ